MGGARIDQFEDAAALYDDVMSRLDGVGRGYLEGVQIPSVSREGQARLLAEWHTLMAVHGAGIVRQFIAAVERETADWKRRRDVDARFARAVALAEEPLLAELEKYAERFALPVEEPPAPQGDMGQGTLTAAASTPGAAGSVGGLGSSRPPHDGAP